MSTCDIPGLGLRVAPNAVPDPVDELTVAEDSGMAVLAGGCFWCTEAVFRRLDGVLDVQPGYAGGAAETANYEAVCSGRTGHAEAIRISYDPTRIRYGMLLNIFLSVAHDPTHMNRQGNDVGTQYRSAVFPADAAQRRVVAAYLAQLTAAGVFAAPIMTTVEPLQEFYMAERYHHDYASRNAGQSYVRYVVMPKVEKLEAYFGDKLAKEGAR